MTLQGVTLVYQMKDEKGSRYEEGAKIRIAFDFALSHSYVGRTPAVDRCDRQAL